MVAQGSDPLAARRARIARGVAAAKRVGYLLLLVAVAGFATAAATGVPGWAVTVTIVALVGACIVLPVPIVIGYGLRAAERDEARRRPRGSASAPPG